MKSYDYSLCLMLFENMVKELSSDSLIKVLLGNMIKNLKIKYLRYVIQNSSSITIKYLSELLNINEKSVLELILKDIENRVVKVKIDLIDNIVYSEKRDALQETLKSTVSSVESLYLANIKKFSQ